MRAHDEPSKVEDLTVTGSLGLSVWIQPCASRQYRGFQVQQKTTALANEGVEEAFFKLALFFPPLPLAWR